MTAEELPHWLEKGVQYFYVHTDPFLRRGIASVKKTLSKEVV